MKKVEFIFVFLLSFFVSSCNSNVDEIADDTKKSEVQEYIYSKDHSIVYASNNGETAFNNQGEIIELANGMFVKKISDDAYIFDSDMLLTADQVKELEIYYEINPESELQLRGTVSQQAKTWSNNTVYYTFNSNITRYFYWEIMDAIEQWSSQTQLKFVRATGAKDYVEFILGDDGRYSNVGRIGGRQYINLDRSWADKGTVMHEIGHAIGMIHEHQCWIFHNGSNNGALVFKWDNIKSSAKSNYTQYSKAHDSYSAGVDDPNYPINSLMIYGSFSNFAIDSSKPVLTYRRYGGFEQTFNAQRSYLSVSDRMAVAKKYGYSYNPATDPNKPPI